MELHPEAPLGMELHEVDPLHPEAPSSSSSTGKRYGLESESSDMRRSAFLGLFQGSWIDEGTQLSHFHKGDVKGNQRWSRLICWEKEIKHISNAVMLAPCTFCICFNNCKTYDSVNMLQQKKGCNCRPNKNVSTLWKSILMPYIEWNEHLETYINFIAWFIKCKHMILRH